MFRTLRVAIILMLLCSFARAQEKPEDGGNSGIIYGKNHGFTLTAPKGWVLDNKSGVKDGLHAVFYPVGSSWLKGSVVMYANVYHKKDVKGESLEQIIAGDVAEYKKRAAGLKVTDAKPLPTKWDKGVKDKEATIKHFTDDEHGINEAVAYIDEGKVVVILVLNAQTKKDFELSLPAFKELVGSYFFLTSSVIMLE